MLVSEVTKFCEDYGLSAGLTAMSVASTTDTDSNSSKAFPAGTIGPYKAGTELVMDATAAAAVSSLAPLSPVYAAIEKSRDRDASTY